MFVHRPHIRNSSLQRMIYIVCLFFVFSYIAFDVLDLDGSNLPSWLAPVQRSLILGVIPSDAEIPYSFDRGENAPRGNNIISTSGKPSRPQVHFSPLTLVSFARAHGYKVSLARNSLSDPSPYG